jgi:lipid II:glycine glycyltransferase (peptidoglycan interpeptide bridge formation enzyme)
MPVRDVKKDEWSDFLTKTSESTFFCSIDWWSTFEDSFLLQVRSKTNELIAGVPFRIVNVVPLLGKFFKFCWLDSSVLVNQYHSGELITSVKEMVFEYLIEHLKALQVIVMFVSSKSRSHDEKIYKKLFNHSEKCATLIVDISKEDSEIFNSLEKRKKTSIRKALKMDVEVKILKGEAGFSLISDYCSIQNKLFEHKSKSYSDIHKKSKTYLKSILKSTESSYIAIAYYKGQPVVGDILVAHKKCLFGYLGASDYVLNKLTSASTLLEYEVMKFAKQEGYRTYDMGGIPVKKPDRTDSLYGIYLFKSGFGGVQHEFDCSTYAIRRHRYRFIWWLRKFETNTFAKRIYNIIK